MKEKVYWVIIKSHTDEFIQQLGPFFTEDDMKKALDYYVGVPHPTDYEIRKYLIEAERVLP